MKEDLKYLQHILENIGWVEKFTKGMSKKEFLTNVEKQYAVMKAIEVIGEAVKNLSLGFRRKYPTIFWRDIAGTRDVLIHAYFRVDLDLLWDVIDKDLPDLKKEMENILKQERQ